MKRKQFLLYNLTTCNLLLVGGALALECRDGQKERKDNLGQPICCYTVKCNASQGFHLCKTDQGSDSCYDCDKNKFTTDRIDTMDATKEHSVCEKIPTCNEESQYLDKTNYRCYCDRSKGFYGEADNCMRSMNTCNYPGYELGNDGKCVVCGKDTFKSGSDNSICKQKTKCKDDEIETSSGSTTTDRTCSKTTSTTTPAPASSTIDDRNKDGSDTGMIVGVVVGLLILIACVVVFCYCRTVKRKSFIEIFKKKKTKRDRISLYDFKSKEAEEPFLPNGDNGSHSRQGNIRHTYFDVPGKGSGRTDFSYQDETSRSESQPSSDSSQTFVKSVVSSSSQTRKTSDESKDTITNRIQSTVTEGPSLTTGNQSTELQRTPTSLEKQPNIKGKYVVHGKQGKFNDTLPKMIHSLVNEGPPLRTGNQSTELQRTPTSPEEQPNVKGKNVAHGKQEKFNDNKTKQLDGSADLNGLSTADDNQIGTSASGSVPAGNLPIDSLFDGLTTITGNKGVENGNRTGKTKQKPMATVLPRANTNENHQLPMLWEQPVSANLNLEPDEADLIGRTHGNQGLNGSEGNGLAENNGIPSESATFIATSAQGNLESRELQYGNPEVSPVTENGHPVVSPEERGQFTDRS